MPHATAPHNFQDEQDDVLIQRALTSDPRAQLDWDRELEPGEKADDAVDFGDLSDDDLADDEDVGGGLQGQTSHANQTRPSSKGAKPNLREGDLQHMANGNDILNDGFDDLFGDNLSSPVERRDGIDQDHPGVDDPYGSIDFKDTLRLRTQPRVSPELSGQSTFHPVTINYKDAPLSKDQQLQQELFAMSRSGLGNLDVPPAPPENQEQLLASLWPKFECDRVPKFMHLLPPKVARYVGKTIPKPPKPLNPTKISLELAQDQVKSFRISSKSNKRTYEEMEHLGIVSIQQDEAEEKIVEEDVDMESEFENETVGGLTWQDLQVVCEDWETHSMTDSFGSSDANLENRDVRGELDYDLEHRIGWPTSKRRKMDNSEFHMIRTPQFSFPSLQNPEHATSKIAKNITLDLNDSRLLVDHVQFSTISRNKFGKSDLKRAGRGAFTKGLSQRYNISNDEAYDLLKENHQSKVRSMLGNVAVEHSLPAIRLQWPFYKTKLEKQDARSFHRPSLRVNRNEQIFFAKTHFIKRKHLKGKDTQTIYSSSKDLSLGDNSNVLLLEYCEEYPTMMSNIGMGNRVINYYRRKTTEDSARPKLDIGEAGILLPQDKSPFSTFGHVDPGQITPALYNGMYRAPIFKQTAKKTDFLVIKSTTAVDGPAWFLRNIENLYAVGQEFPSVDVPGPHSRKVTTASKNRLKMISYRLIRKNKTHRISVSDVTNHFADTSDMQNRQKMKEFMQFNREHKEWQMRSGEAIPDEETVRTMIKPEDVCLLESMQVGQQHLQDAGFNKEDDESEGDDAKEGQSIEQQLAPWFTSRNFLHATQGKAMLQLHGDGDPSGRGEAFSFIKTSMKGGFKAEGESAADKMKARNMKESNGHAYNVQRQQKSYEDSIRRIWEAQKNSLSSTIEQSDSDIDEDADEEASTNMIGAGTPRSDAQTPAPMRRRDDDTASQFSKLSTGSQAGKLLRITRHVRDEDGNLEKIEDDIREPKVIRQYLRRRHAKEAENTGVTDIKPTGNAEQDRRNKQRLEKELARLNRNKERRIARDKQKGVHFDGAADSPKSPSSPAAAITKTAGTQRKCANCGQVGHIKTNKKLCPMLNGTMKQEEGFSGSAFTLGTPTL